MKRKIGLQILAPTFGGLILLGCCVVFGGTRIRVEQGTKFCAILSFPRPLSEANPEKSYMGLQYEFRKSPNSPEWILFTLKPTYSGSGPFNVYRFTLSRPAQIQVATRQEWDKGVPLAEVPKGGEIREDFLEGAEPPSDRVSTADNRTFSYNRRKLEKSGDLWEPEFRPVLFSPAKTYAALQSWNGWTAGKTSGDGPFFVDIYHLGTGKRIALIRGDRCRITPEFVLVYTLWLTDTDLVMPFPFDRSREILVCHFDR